MSKSKKKTKKSGSAKFASGAETERLTGLGQHAAGASGSLVNQTLFCSAGCSASPARITSSAVENGLVHEAGASGSTLETVAADPQIQAIFDKLKQTGTSRTLKVLFVGKTGVGKSSLRYSILGIKKTPDPTEDVDGKIVSLEGNFEGVSVEFIDTPGLDKVSGKAGEKYVRDVGPNIEDADIILFCFEANKPAPQAIHHEDAKIIAFLKKCFGNRFLAKTIVVLTFGNCIKVHTESGESIETKQMSIKQSVENGLKEKMEQARFKKVLVDNTKFVRADDPTNADEWIVEFLKECLTSAITENAKIALLQTTYKLWSEKAIFDGSTKSIKLSAGISMITIGIPTVLLPIVGIPLITVGAIVIAWHCDDRQKECSENAITKERFKCMKPEH